MIIDKIENVSDYFHLSGLKKGLEFFRTLGDNPELKRYDFEGGFFVIAEGDTMPANEGMYESHRKYVDVQYILEGCEEVGWADIHELKLVIPYEEEKDMAMYEGDLLQVNTMKAGMFWVALPQDAHKPARHTKTSHHFKKVIFKLLYEGGK